MNLVSNVENEVDQPTVQTIEQLIQPPFSKIIKINQRKIDIDTLIHDLGKCPQIWDYPINQQEQIHRAYIKFGPHQFVMDEYPFLV